MKNIKFKKISRKAKIAISLLSIGIFSFSAYSAVSAKNATNNKVYLVDIDDCDERTKIYDENGNLINFQVEEGLLAIVDDYRTKPDKMYQTVIINNEGKMTSGYMDGKYLNDTFLDSIEHVSLSKSDISEVIAKDGLWLRKSNDISKYEDSFSYLENGKNVILSDMSFYSKNNSYDWKQGISVDVDSKKMQVGYLASDYVIDKDFEKKSKKKVFINVPDGEVLKLRNTPNNDSTDSIIDEIPNNAEIEILEDNNMIRNGNIEWTFVKYTNDGIVKYGYVAAIIYNDDGSVNLSYISEKNNSDVDETEADLLNVSEENTEIEETMLSDETSTIGTEDIADYIENDIIKFIVDTKNDGGIALKLRSNPGFDSKIIAQIEDGTEVSTSSVLYNTESEVDNHSWIKVTAPDGKTGYVAKEYLRKLDSSLFSITFTDPDNADRQTTVEGYLAADVNADFPPELLDDILTKGHQVTSTGSYQLDMYTKPEAVIIKMAATGYGIFSQADTDIEDVKKLVAVCEKHQVPYGLYYYSQALSKEEAAQEIEWIKNKLGIISELGDLKYNLLPFYLDYEIGDIEQNSRVRQNYEKLNSDEDKDKSITSVLDYELSKLRDTLGTEVCLYSDHNTLGVCFDVNEFTDVNKENIWMVDVSPAHSKDTLDLKNHISMRQVSVDSIIEYNGDSHKIDYDLINKEYFDKIKDKAKKLKRSDAIAKYVDDMSENENVSESHCSLVKR